MKTVTLQFINCMNSTGEIRIRFGFDFEWNCRDEIAKKEIVHGIFGLFVCEPEK